MCRRLAFHSDEKQLRPSDKAVLLLPAIVSSGRCLVSLFQALRYATSFSVIVALNYGKLKANRLPDQFFLTSLFFIE
jgi:hypothetical protein